MSIPDQPTPSAADSPRRLAPDPPVNDVRDQPQAPPPRDGSAFSASLPDRHHAYAETLLQRLVSQATPGAADEELLARMTANAAGTLTLVDEAQVLVTVAIHRHLDDPRALLNLTSAFQRLVAIGNGLSHRVNLSLGTTASLQAQRRITKAKGSSR